MDHSNGIVLAGKLNMPAANHPSSNNSVLQKLARNMERREIKLTETSPNFSIVDFQLEDALKILDSLMKLLLCP